MRVALSAIARYDRVIDIDKVSGHKRFSNKDSPCSHVPDLTEAQTLSVRASVGLLWPWRKVHQHALMHFVGPGIAELVFNKDSRSSEGAFGPVLVLQDFSGHSHFS